MNVSGVIQEDDFFSYFPIKASDGTDQHVYFDSDKIDIVRANRWKVNKVDGIYYVFTDKDKLMHKTLFGWFAEDEKVLFFVDSNPLNNTCHNIRSRVAESETSPNSCVHICKKNTETRARVAVREADGLYSTTVSLSFFRDPKSLEELRCLGREMRDAVMLDPDFFEAAKRKETA